MPSGCALWPRGSRRHGSRRLRGLPAPRLRTRRRRTARTRRGPSDRPRRTRDALQFAERARAGDPIDLEPVGRLEAPHRALGQRAIATIDRARVESVATKLPLEHADLRRPGAGVTRLGVDHGRPQRPERQRTRDAVHAQATRALEPLDGVLGPRAVVAVDRAGRVSLAVEATLQRADEPRVLPACVAAARRQHGLVGRLISLRCPPRRGERPGRLSGYDQHSGRRQYGGPFRG
jgi:hypothetical protein